MILSLEPRGRSYGARAAGVRGRTRGRTRLLHSASAPTAPSARGAWFAHCRPSSVEPTGIPPMTLEKLSSARRLALVLAAMLALSLVTSLFAFLTLRSLGAEVTAMVSDNLK